MERRVFLALMLAPVSAYAHSYSHGKLAIGHAWALPTPLTEGQVFFPVLNAGENPDFLVAARSDIAPIIELRVNNHYDDPPEVSFKLEPKKPFPMRPTARHIRLLGLIKPLKAGDSFRIILDFEIAGEVEIVVDVEQAPSD